HLLSIIALSFAHDGVIDKATRAYFGLSAAIDFTTLEAALTNISSEDRWERRASRELAEELEHARIKLTEHLLTRDGTEPLDEYFERERPRQFNDALRLIAELKSASSISVAAL